MERIFWSGKKTFVKLWIRNSTKSENLFSTCIWYLLKFNRRTFENTKYVKWWLFKRLWSCEVCSCGSYLGSPPGNIQLIWIKIHFHCLGYGLIMTWRYRWCKKNNAALHHVLAIGVTDSKSSSKTKCDWPKFSFEKHQGEEGTQSSA